MKQKITWFDRIMAAVSFAEADEPATARGILTDIAHTPEKREKCKDHDVLLAPDMQGVDCKS
jgi:hypothetical protein